MGHMELSRSCLPGFAPGEDQLAVRSEFVDPGVAVTVGDIQVSGVVQSDITGPIKGTCGLFRRLAVVSRPPGIRGFVPFAQGHEEITVWTILQHNMAILDRHV